MWDLVARLVPEMLGLAVTPAAVIACLLLLGSSHPFRNVAALGGVFLVAYAALSAAVLAVGRASDTSTDDPSATRGWLSLVVGVLFLVAGLVSWVRTPRRAVDAGASPGWVMGLRDPSLRFVLAAGLVLAVLNPNVAILVSGLAVILTADVDAGTEVAGAAFLLSANMVDFVVPTLAFVIAGAAGRARLREATRWLIAHNRVIGIVVLVAFGLLFTGRALGQLFG